MKSMKHIIIPVSFAMALLFAGCEEWLEVYPTRSLPTEIAIQDEKGLMNGINGCYDALQFSSIYGRSLVNISALASDNAYNGGTIKEYGQFNNNTILADNSTIEGTWSGLYTAINRANSILEAIDGLDDMEETTRDSYRAELRFLRALHYFNLVRCFGEVPLREEATTDLSSLDVPVSPYSDLYQFILDDLEFADGKINGSSPVRATNWAAKALMAKVYLHMEDYGNAASIAGEIIDNGPFTLEPRYADLFEMEGSAESIFEVDFNENDKNRMAEYFFPNQLTGRYEVAPEEGFIESYEPEDTARFNATVKYTGSTPYVAKYENISLGSDNVYVFRLAEIHLIRAEALANDNGDLDVIKGDINAVRNRAKLGNTTAGTYEELKMAIEKERRYELAFEGHRWFDLVRTGRAVDVLENVTSENQYLFPIPLAETSSNESID